MVNVKLYDNVLLKDGRKASIVEIFDDSYIVDIDVGGDYSTQSVGKSDVAKVIN